MFEYRPGKPKPYVMRWRNGGRQMYQGFAEHIDRRRAAESMKR